MVFLPPSRHGAGVTGWLMLLANIFWAVAYDTEYAMVDRPDDLKIGIKRLRRSPSAATTLAVMLCYAATFVLLTVVGALAGWAFASVRRLGPSPAPSPATTTPPDPARATAPTASRPSPPHNWVRRRDLRRPLHPTSCCALEPCRLRAARSASHRTDPHALHDRPSAPPGSSATACSGRPRPRSAGFPVPCRRSDAILRFCTQIETTPPPTCVLLRRRSPTLPRTAPRSARGAGRAHPRPPSRHPVVPTPSAATSAAPPSSTPSRPSSASSADAITVNPTWAATRSIPTWRMPDKGVIPVLPHLQPGRFGPAVSGGRYVEAGRTVLYEHVARTVAEDWNASGNCAFVVGATFPAEIARACARRRPAAAGAGHRRPGGDIVATLAVARNENGTGLMINSSRAVLYAGKGRQL